MKDLKAFAHPDSGHWQVVDLHEVIEGALRIVAASMGSAPGREGLREGDPAAALPADAARAGHHERPRQRLTGRTAERNITVRTGRTGSEAWVEIEDNGAGIQADHLNRLFDPFFTTKAVGVGTGLGLSIAHGIVRAHGGRIEVRTSSAAARRSGSSCPISGEERAFQGAGGPDPYVS